MALCGRRAYVDGEVEACCSAVYRFFAQQFEGKDNGSLPVLFSRARAKTRKKRLGTAANSPGHDGTGRTMHPVPVRGDGR